MILNGAALCYDNDVMGNNFLSATMASITEYGDKVYQSGAQNLSFKEGKVYEELVDKISELGENKLFYRPFQKKKKKEDDAPQRTFSYDDDIEVIEDAGIKKTVILFRDGYFSVVEYPHKKKANAICISFESKSEELIKSFIKIQDEFCELYSDEEKTTKKIHCIVSRSQGLDIEEMGEIDSPLVRDNYEPHVSAGYDKIISDLNSKDPSGRFIILDGPPGTGKTYLIRAIVSDTANKDIVFVLLPPKYIESLMDASLTTVLHEFKQDFDKDITICLLVEDADILLTERLGGNIDAISAALNLGDGIFGQLFDVRIVASTNTPIRNIDPAILRPGRLSARIDVGEITAETANKAFERLCDEVGTFKAKKTLAEVYQAAKSSNEGSAVGNIMFEAEVEKEDLDKYII
tara:strand:- start:3406 stop:4623 length:1218 start_codon:yes stop_codon:yes gene_type:complete